VLSAYRRRIVDRRTPQFFRELQLLTFGQLSEFRKLCECHTVEFEVKFVPVNFGLSWLTSKMSHNGSWRAACLIRNWILHLKTHSFARGVTSPGVGSGALLGVWANEN